jgi:tyrosine decarboxylase/aspartate 1-decarboxylase
VAATRAAALTLAGGLSAHDSVALVVQPELDIVCSFARLPAASAISAAGERAFDTLAADGWHVAKLRVDTAWLRRRHPWIEADAPTVTVLRSCLLKREHLDVAAELAGATAAALTAGRA